MLFHKSVTNPKLERAIAMKVGKIQFWVEDTLNAAFEDVVTPGDVFEAVELGVVEVETLLVVKVELEEDNVVVFDDDVEVAAEDVVLELVADVVLEPAVDWDAVEEELADDEAPTKEPMPQGIASPSG